MKMKTLFGENRNISLFYGLSIANGVSFIIGNWIFFWMRLMTYGELGLVNNLAFAFGLLMEILTGAIADLTGKKKTLMICSMTSIITCKYAAGITNNQ